MNLTDDEVMTALKIELAAGDAMVVTTELAENTLEMLAKQKAEIKRLDTALSVALKFNSDLEADKRLANVELDRLNSEVARLTSDCKTLSAVLSRDIDHDKQLISTFVSFLEEHAREWIMQRPNAGYEYTLKYVYIEEDVKRLEKEFWEGDNNDEN